MHPIYKQHIQTAACFKSTCVLEMNPPQLMKKVPRMLPKLKAALYLKVTCWHSVSMDVFNVPRNIIFGGGGGYLERTWDISRTFTLWERS